MWWDRSNHTSYRPVICHNLDSLRQQNLTPPAAKCLKTDHTVFCDLCHHKAHFIHVAGNHYSGAFPVFHAKNAAKIILNNMICILFQLLFHEIANEMLIAWGSL